VQCLSWSRGVYEDSLTRKLGKYGMLCRAHHAIREAAGAACDLCGTSGASVACAAPGCASLCHFGCAVLGDHLLFAEGRALCAGCRESGPLLDELGGRGAALSPLQLCRLAARHLRVMPRARPRPEVEAFKPLPKAPVRKRRAGEGEERRAGAGEAEEAAARAGEPARPGAGAADKKDAEGAAAAPETPAAAPEEAAAPGAAAPEEAAPAAGGQAEPMLVDAGAGAGASAEAGQGGGGEGAGEEAGAEEDGKRKGALRASKAAAVSALAGPPAAPPDPEREREERARAAIAAVGKALAARGEELARAELARRREQRVRELAEEVDAFEGGHVTRLAREVRDGVLMARVGALTVHRLGRIIPEHDAFHSELAIYPVGVGSLPPPLPLPTVAPTRVPTVQSLLP
jgi:hypothetical protein